MSVGTKLVNKAHGDFGKVYIVRWLSEITVTRRIKAPNFACGSLIMY